MSVTLELDFLIMVIFAAVQPVVVLTPPWVKFVVLMVNGYQVVSALMPVVMSLVVENVVQIDYVKIWVMVSPILALRVNVLTLLIKIDILPAVAKQTLA